MRNCGRVRKMSRGKCKFKTMDTSDGLFTKGFEDQTLLPEQQDIECKELSDEISFDGFSDELEIKGGGLSKAAKYTGDKLATGALWGIGGYASAKAAMAADKKYSQTKNPPVRVTIYDRSKRAEAEHDKKKKGLQGDHMITPKDDLIVKELDDDLEVKGVIGRTLVESGIGSALGASVGAASSKKGERLQGAKRGAVAGAVLGPLGSKLTRTVGEARLKRAIGEVGEEAEWARRRAKINYDDVMERTRKRVENPREFLRHSKIHLDNYNLEQGKINLGMRRKLKDLNDKHVRFSSRNAVLSPAASGLAAGTGVGIYSRREKNYEGDIQVKELSDDIQTKYIDAKKKD
jgi:archaeosine-15-forming tRNA-guanine transglycosylase